MIDNDVPAGSVLDLDELFHDPQLKHNNSVLEFEHPTVGNFEYRAYVPPMAGEKNTDDNEYIVPVQVIDARNRLLYVEGAPRWDYKFLRRVLLAQEQRGALLRDAHHLVRVPRHRVRLLHPVQERPVLGRLLGAHDSTSARCRWRFRRRQRRRFRRRRRWRFRRRRRWRLGW